MPVSAAGTSQLAMVRIAYRRSVGAILLCVAVVVVLIGLPVVWVRSAVDTILTLTMVAVWIAIGVRLLRTSHGGLLTVVLLVLVATTPLAMLGTSGTSGVHPVIAVAPAVIAIVGSIVLVDEPWSWLLGGLVLVATAVAVWADAGAKTALSWSWPVLVFGLNAAAVKIGLHRAAMRADRRVVQHRQVEMALIQARAHETAHTIWQGLLHDDVAAALRAAATVGVSRQEVRRSAREALDAIGAVDDPPATESSDIMAAIRQLAVGSSVAVEVAGPAELFLPPAVATACVGAVIESLRNVERHADGAGAEVVVTQNEERVTVRIRDEGPGFVFDRLREGGLQVSVIDRVAQADGHAEVVSLPGQGTTTTLTWPLERVTAQSPEPFADLNRILGLSVSPVLGAAGVLALSQRLAGEGMIFGLLWFVAVVLITAVLAWWSGPGLPRWVVPTGLVVVVIGVLALQSVPHQPSTDDVHAWPLLAAAPVLLLAVLGGSVRYGIAATVLLLVGTPIVDGGTGQTGTLAAEAVVAALLSVGLSVGWVVRRLGAEVEQAAIAERHQLEESWQSTVNREVYARRQARLEEIVVPFLHEIANASTVDDVLQERATLMEQAVRDEMHLPEVLDAPTRALLREIRTAGCRVRLQSDSASTISAERVCAVMHAALAYGDVPREITVSVYASGDRPTMSVVALPGDRVRREALKHCCPQDVLVLEDNEDATWAEIRLTS